MKFSDLRLKLGRAKRAEHLIEVIQGALKLTQQQPSSKSMSAAPNPSGSAPPPKQNDDAEQDPGRLVGMLRELLASERANSERRRQNNAVLQKYVQSLKEDQLRLQSDLEQALQFGHRMKAQKQVQIECLETNLKQKDELIDQLKAQLDKLDDTKLRAEFETATKKLLEHHQLELDQLRKQVELSEQQLSCERANNTNQAQQSQEKFNEQLKLHERELELLRERLEQSQRDLERVLEEPQNLMIKALRGEKRQLDTQVEELNLSLEENQTRFDSMRKRLELILAEQERLAKQNQEELERLQQSNVEQRKLVVELKSEVEDKQETIQLMEFDLNRSEKRVESLLTVLKDKEATYRELINKSETEHGEELEKVSTKLQASDRRIIELEHELTAKQNELLAARLDQENCLESLRNDRDERLNKLTLDKENLARRLQSIELRLACECEQSQHRLGQVEQLQTEALRLREENNLLSIELTKRDSKLEVEQRDLLAAKRELMELKVANESSGDQVQIVSRLREELEGERANSRKFKANMDSFRRDNEKLCAKLRIAESNLLKMRSTVNREHERMMRDYEKKLESIKSEQLTFDRNRLRYKRYGYRLKKYCEHLRRVHGHMCNPSSCGYFIGTTMRSASGSIGSKQSSAYVNCDNASLLDSDGDAQNSGSPYYDEISGDEDSPQSASMKRSGKFDVSPKPDNNPPSRFVIKRTGLGSATIPTDLFSAPLGNPKICPRGPLQSKSTNTMSSRTNSKQPVSCSPANQNKTRLPASRGAENPYYYYNPSMTKKSTPVQAQRPTPVERKLGGKLATPELRRSIPSKVVKPPILSTEL